ncbi:hypothetical protein I350_03861 [Cryptococcus amylolentus CBS 6273]|uniref:Uncharacterized protein n=1 Tax=Cryptococcus amylolentus CBS 6273 TaxID=1296118 RepID=A0A1E3K5E1_9TREE|nr:hypothetical protein I350_03861 [Cryptococcus amylolentus CBS 6273]
MNYPDEAPTAVTYPHPPSYDQDDEAFLADLDWQVDPTLSSHWDKVTIQQLRNMSDDDLERTRAEWQIFSQAAELNNITLEMDSGLRAFLENSIGELTKLRPRLHLKRSSKASPVTFAQRVARWRKKKMESDPEWASKQNERRRQAYADLKKRLKEGEESSTISPAQRSVAEDPDWANKDKELSEKAQSLTKEANATE